MILPESAVVDVSVSYSGYYAELTGQRFGCADAFAAPSAVPALVASVISMAALVIDAVVIVRALALALIIVAVMTAVYCNRAE